MGLLFFALEFVDASRYIFLLNIKQIATGRYRSLWNVMNIRKKNALYV